MRRALTFEERGGRAPLPNMNERREHFLTITTERIDQELMMNNKVSSFTSPLQEWNIMESSTQTYTKNLHEADKKYKDPTPLLL